MANPTTTDSKSTKYNQAVARATGAEAPAGEGTSLSKPIGKAMDMFKPTRMEEIEEMAASERYEFAPQLVSLEAGMTVEGYLEGVGPGADFTDKVTGRQYHVDSWIIGSMDKATGKRGGIRISILSSAQLDKKLPPFVGGYVYIARGQDLKIEGNRKCGDYFVGGERLATGARTWAMPTTKALPEGAEDAEIVAHTPATPTNGAPNATA